MEKKTFEKLQSIATGAPKRAMDAIEIICGYPNPRYSNKAINTFMAYAMDNKFKKSSLEYLGLEGLSDEALSIIFRELYKEFTKNVGKFVPNNLPVNVNSAYNALIASAKATFDHKDPKAIASWLYIKLSQYVDLVKTDYNRLNYLLTSDNENFVYGGLKEIGIPKDYIKKFMPIGKSIGALLIALANPAPIPAVSAEPIAVEATVKPRKLRKFTPAGGNAINKALEDKGISLTDYLTSLSSDEFNDWESDDSQVGTTFASVQETTNAEVTAEPAEYQPKRLKDGENAPFLNDSEINEVFRQLKIEESIQSFMEYMLGVYGVDLHISYNV